MNHSKMSWVRVGALALGIVGVAPVALGSDSNANVVPVAREAAFFVALANVAIPEYSVHFDSKGVAHGPEWELELQFRFLGISQELVPSIAWYPSDEKTTGRLTYRQWLLQPKTGGGVGLSLGEGVHLSHDAVGPRFEARLCYGHWDHFYRGASVFVAPAWEPVASGSWGSGALLAGVEFVSIPIGGF